MKPTGQNLIHTTHKWKSIDCVCFNSLIEFEYLIIYTEADEFYLITSTWNIIVIDNTDFKLLTWVKIESLILNQNWIKIYFK